VRVVGLEADVVDAHLVEQLHADVILKKQVDLAVVVDGGS
jgi:hypothetical protein